MIVPPGISDPILRRTPLELLLDVEERRWREQGWPFNRVKEKQRQLWIKRAVRLFDGKGVGRANKAFEQYWKEKHGDVMVPEEESD